MIRIITDSTCDLSQELIKEFNIEIIPLYVTFNDDSYKDGIEINSEKLYEEVDKRKMLPKTSAAPMLDFMNYFKNIIDNGDEAFYVGIGSKLSTTLNNANMAIEELGTDKIMTADSKNLSTGISLIVLKACKDRDNGLSLKEIKENADKNADKVLAQFAIESTEFLRRGGRCSSIASLAATVLRIKPIIEVREGKLSVGKKPIGKMKRAIDMMNNQIMDDKDNVDNDFIFVTHSYQDDGAKYIIPILKEEFPNARIVETSAGCVISSHCGKGTIGILYMLK